MRGENTQQATMFVMKQPGELVPEEHPLRKIKLIVDEILERLSRELSGMYSRVGRPSIAPERLLKAQLLQGLYSIRSERQLCEQLSYNLLYKWFLDMGVDDAVFDATSFTKNRERLMEHEVSHRFLREVVKLAQEHELISTEHFSVDGTLIEAWASLKSFRPKDEKPKDSEPPEGPKSNRWVDFKGEKRSNATHESKTDPEAKLYRKGFGKEAKLAFSGNALMENRNALIVATEVVGADGHAERQCALRMIDKSEVVHANATLGADKGYDSADFVEACRRRKVTPHLARSTARKGGSALDERTTRHVGYTISQRIRKRIEEPFGWLKQQAGLKKTKLRGVQRNDFLFRIGMALHNILRLTKLLPQFA
jgi:transposase